MLRVRIRPPPPPGSGTNVVVRSGRSARSACGIGLWYPGADRAAVIAARLEYVFFRVCELSSLRRIYNGLLNICINNKQIVSNCILINILDST